MKLIDTPTVQAVIEALRISGIILDEGDDLAALLIVITTICDQLIERHALGIQTAEGLEFRIEFIKACRRRDNV